MKEMKPRHAVPIGPYLDKSALLKMGYLDASSSLAMTSMTIAELWSREKVRLRRGCPFRQKDLDPYFTVEEIEEARRSLAKRLQGWARAEKRAECQKAYAPRRTDITGTTLMRARDADNGRPGGDTASPSFRENRSSSQGFATATPPGNGACKKTARQNDTSIMLKK